MSGVRLSTPAVPVSTTSMRIAKEYGIKGPACASLYPYAVAEHAMTIIQATPTAASTKSYIKVKDNNFALSGLLGVDLNNKVAGILGTGRIGQIVMHLPRMLALTVMGWDAFPNKSLEEGLLTYASRDVLRKADLTLQTAPTVMGDGGAYRLIDESDYQRQ